MFKWKPRDSEIEPNLLLGMKWALRRKTGHGVQEKYDSGWGSRRDLSKSFRG